MERDRETDRQMFKERGRERDSLRNREVRRQTQPDRLVNRLTGKKDRERMGR